MSALFKGIKTTLTKANIGFVKLKKKEDVTEMLEFFISCEDLEYIALESVKIPKYDFRFVFDYIKYE